MTNEPKYITKTDFGPKIGSFKKIVYKKKCLICGYLTEESVGGIETEIVKEIENHIKLAHKTKYEIEND